MKRRILLITLLVAILGVLAWLVLRPSEPVYEGKRLTYWLDQCGFGYGEHTYDAEEQARARNAIRHIGTNAIPTLLHMLRAKDSPFALKMMQLFSRQNLVASPFIPAAEKNLEAFFDFNILGAEGKGAVPELIKIFEENISEFSQLEAAEALGAIGPDAKTAIPTLLSYVTNTNSLVNTKATVIRALGRIHSEPEAVVPVMLGCLNDTNLIVQMQAIGGLGEFGPAAQQSVPALLAEATNSASRLRGASMFALKKINPEAATKAGVK